MIAIMLVLSLVLSPAIRVQAAGQVRGDVSSYAEGGQGNRTVGGNILCGLSLSASSGDKGDSHIRRGAEC